MMVDAVCTNPIPRTTQELEQAIRRFKSSDLSGTELFCQWQAIRTAALNLKPSEPQSDQVAGEDSY
jgi:hypothetical protein